MSAFAALTTLFLFSGFVVSEVSWAPCDIDAYNWVWEYNISLPTCCRQLIGLSFQTQNSLTQSPCEVGAYLIATCLGESRCSPYMNYCSLGFSYLADFTLITLDPDEHYIGPNSQTQSYSCICTTVVYSLLSACDGCQGSSWIGYCPLHLCRPSFMSGYLPSGGLNGWLTVLQSSLLRREFPAVIN